MKLGHTWYEGIRVCKALPQSSAAIELHLNGNQENDIDSASNGDDMTNFKPVVVSAKAFALTPISISTTHDPTHTSASTATITQGCETLFNLALVTSTFNLLF